MPLREFACACGAKIEILQAPTDPPAQICPICRAPMRVLMSTASIAKDGTYSYREGGR